MSRTPIYGERQAKRNVRATQEHWAALQAMAKARGYRGLSAMLAAIAIGELMVLSVNEITEGENKG